jgi:hypothetical protein
VGPGFTPTNTFYNHSSAEKYPGDVEKYITKEYEAGALKIFDISKLNNYHISPLMSRPKDASGRRIILDLSWPQEKLASINACVQVDTYLGTQFLLKLPTVDHITSIVNSFNTPVCIFKIDLARAFRQIPLDPLDAAYLGICWAGKTYFDTAVPFGWRHGSAACQRITDAIRHILYKYGVITVNYIDNFMGIVPIHDADRAFQLTAFILREVGLVTSIEKTVYPTHRTTCLGIVVDTQLFTLSIPLDKLKNIIVMCRRYINSNKISKNQIQSLLGSLIYMHKAILPTRSFVNRIIALLKTAPDKGYIKISQEFKRDLHWFIACSELYNGISKFDITQEYVDYNVYVDASGVGLGACVNNMVYAFPIEGKQDNIAYWEAINVLFTLRTWAHMFRHKLICIHCDNKAAVSMFNTSRGTDCTLQAIAHNIWLLAATFDMRLRFEHIPGQYNCVADLLSRWWVTHNPVAKLYTALGNQPIWSQVDSNNLALNWQI